MKKAAVILLISIYTLSTFGFCLKEFYCCGKLKSITVILHMKIKNAIRKKIQSYAKQNSNSTR